MVGFLCLLSCNDAVFFEKTIKSVIKNTHEVFDDVEDEEIVNFIKILNCEVLPLDKVEEKNLEEGFEFGIPICFKKLMNQNTLNTLPALKNNKTKRQNIKEYPAETYKEYWDLAKKVFDNNLQNYFKSIRPINDIKLSTTRWVKLNDSWVVRANHSSDSLKKDIERLKQILSNNIK